MFPCHVTNNYADDSIVHINANYPVSTDDEVTCTKWLLVLQKIAEWVKHLNFVIVSHRVTCFSLGCSATHYTVCLSTILIQNMPQKLEYKMLLNSTLSEDFLNRIIMLSCTQRLRRSKLLDCVKLPYTVNTCTASLPCGLTCEYLDYQTDWISCCICNIRAVSLPCGLFCAQQGYASFWIVCHKQYSVFLWAMKDCFVVNRLSHTVHKYGLDLSWCECSVWSLLSASVFSSNFHMHNTRQYYMWDLVYDKTN